MNLIGWLKGQLADSITVKQMASQADLSVRTLHRKRRQAFALTPAQLFSELRLERSRSLLEGDKLAIKSIAGECGYSQVSAYSKAFKSRYGVAPGDYRLGFRAGSTGAN